MAFRSVRVQLRTDQVEQLDSVARQQRVSRSSLVREAVDASLRPRADRAVAELYAVLDSEPLSGVDDWGDLDAWHAAAADARARTERDPW